MKHFLLLITLFFCSFSDTLPIDHQIDMDGYNVQCSNFNQFGIQRCTAGIESSSIYIKEQTESQWCWAACIAGIFNYYGYNIRQEDVVYQTWGQLQNMPGQPYDILSALNRSYVDRDGNRFTATANTLTASHVTAAQDLSQNYPLIVGTLGHATVLTAVTYDRNQYGNGNIVNAIVRDPWPLAPQKRSLSPQEWYNISFLARIRVYAD